MGLKDMLNRISEKRNAKKEMVRQAEDELRVEKIVSDKQKSANERELERFMKEEREVMIKNNLDKYRKQRQKDINFNHNPLNTKNIMKAQWEVMKEPNMFANTKNIFVNQPFIHKSNSNLLKNNPNLFRI